MQDPPSGTALGRPGGADPINFFTSAALKNEHTSIGAAPALPLPLGVAGGAAAPTGVAVPLTAVEPQPVSSAMSSPHSAPARKGEVMDVHSVERRIRYRSMVDPARGSGTSGALPGSFRL